MLRGGGEGVNSGANLRDVILEWSYILPGVQRRAFQRQFRYHRCRTCHRHQGPRGRRCRWPWGTWHRCRLEVPVGTLWPCSRRCGARRTSPGSGLCRRTEGRPGRGWPWLHCSRRRSTSHTVRDRQRIRSFLELNEQAMITLRGMAGLLVLCVIFHIVINNISKNI